MKYVNKEVMIFFFLIFSIKILEHEYYFSKFNYQHAVPPQKEKWRQVLGLLRILFFESYLPYYKGISIAYLKTINLV